MADNTQYLLNQGLFELKQNTIIELYELYLSDTEGVFRFHPGKNFTKNIFFLGNEYFALPIESSGFEARSDGRLARPTISLANIDGFITSLIKNRNDLVGRKVVRKKLFAKNLDGINFTEGFNLFSFQTFQTLISEDLFLINRTTEENKYTVQFELVSPTDLENSYLPARQMASEYCPFSYRGQGCNYGFTKNYNYQTVNLTNGNTQSSKMGWNSTSTNVVFSQSKAGWNLGIPVADEKDKSFFDKNGYNITGIEYKGNYLSTASYGIGDFVRVRDNLNFDFTKTIVETRYEVSPVSFFVCYAVPAGSSTFVGYDPRTSLQYWVKDQCSRRFAGCISRFGQNKDGIPYGGFPAIDDYPDAQ